MRHSIYYETIESLSIFFFLIVNRSFLRHSATFFSFFFFIQASSIRNRYIAKIFPIRSFNNRGAFHALLETIFNNFQLVCHHFVVPDTTKQNVCTLWRTCIDHAKCKQPWKIDIPCPRSITKLCDIINSRDTFIKNTSKNRAEKVSPHILWKGRIKIFEFVVSSIPIYRSYIQLKSTDQRNYPVNNASGKSKN